MNTENDVKEFGFRHILINTVYNVQQGMAYRYPALLSVLYLFHNLV